MDPTVDVIVEAVEPVEPDTPAPRAAVVPPPVRGVVFFCKQFGKRIWQLCLYTTFVAPPSILAGIACATLLFAIKLATAFRNGTCAESNVAAFLDTEHPLIACTDVVGARRWLFFL